MDIPAYFRSRCGDVCHDRHCPEAVKLNPETGRWFITLSHPGFNSPTNNRAGYASRNAAMAAFRRYAKGR